jgi:hypothetical protein
MRIWRVIGLAFLIMCWLVVGAIIVGTGAAIVRQL